MKSITQALVWESSRHWHWLALGFLGAALFPFLSLFSLRALGLPPDAPELNRLHNFLIPFHCLVLSIGVIGMQGPTQRLYGYPISSAQIAVWVFVSGAVSVALGVAITLVWFNLQFQLAWPVLGPTLYAVMAFSLVQPVRVAHKTSFTVVLTLVIVTLLAVGFVLRYDGFSRTPRIWSQTTALEILTMIGLSIASLVAYVQVIALDRHGEDRKDYLAGWINNLRFDAWNSQRRFPKFASGFAAQSWYQWRSQGRIYTYVGIGMMVVASIIYCLQPESANPFKPDPRLSVELVISLGWLTLFAVVFGLGFGVLNPDNSNSRREVSLEDSIRNSDSLRMGSFLAVLPVNNEQLARAILLSAAKVSFFSIAALLVISLVISAIKVDLVSGLWRSSFAGWYWLGLLLLPWSTMSLAATCGLFGRARLIVTVVAVSIGLGVLIALPATQGWTVLLTAVLSVLAAIAAVVVGVRRGDTSAATVAIAWIGWGVLLMLILLARPIELSTLTWSWIVLLATIAVLPILSMPVALSFNRHR